MSVASLSVRDVVVMTAPLVADRYGDAVFDWDHPTVRTIPGWVSQSASLVTNDHRVQVSSNTTLFVAADAAITAYDRIEIDGDVYQLDGDPNIAWTPRGAHHMECSLRRVEG